MFPSSINDSHQRVVKWSSCNEAALALDAGEEIRYPFKGEGASENSNL